MGVLCGMGLGLGPVVHARGKISTCPLDPQGLGTTYFPSGFKNESQAQSIGVFVCPVLALSSQVSGDGKVGLEGISASPSPVLDKQQLRLVLEH